MSVAGSIPLVMYVVIWFLCKENLNYLLGKTLLIISMAFYLLPVQLLERLLPDKIYEVVDWEVFETMRSSKLYIDGEDSYISIKDGIMWIPHWVIWILTAWFLGALIFAVHQIIKYRRSVKYLLKDSEEIFCEMEGLGTVPILVNDKITTAYTIGLIHSYIVFPRDLSESECRSSIYRHEYCHAKNHDALVKLICLVIICVHWFNPIAILLLFSYCHLCEYISDDYAAKGYTYEQRKQYALLLIESRPAKGMPVIWRNNFLSTKYLLQRRIMYIMKKKNSKFSKLTTVIISLAAIVMSSLTVFGYEPLQSTTEEAVTGTSEGDFIEFMMDNKNSYTPSKEISFGDYECVFVTDDGKVVYVGLDSPQAICNHKFETGYLYKHISNGKGGCTVYEYTAERCTKCNYIKTKELINTITFAKCTHS